LIYLGLTNILEGSLQCREVSMDVIDGGNPHDRP
jgi:hypothetical protein